MYSKYKILTKHPLVIISSAAAFDISPFLLGHLEATTSCVMGWLQMGSDLPCRVQPLQEDSGPLPLGSSLLRPGAPPYRSFYFSWVCPGRMALPADSPFLCLCRTGGRQRLKVPFKADCPSETLSVSIFSARPFGRGGRKFHCSVFRWQWLCLCLSLHFSYYIITFSFPVSVSPSQAIRSFKAFLCA